MIYRNMNNQALVHQPSVRLNLQQQQSSYSFDGTYSTDLTAPPIGAKWLSGWNMSAIGNLVTPPYNPWRKN